MRRWIPLVLLVAVLVLTAAALSPRGRVITETLALLADVWTIGSPAPIAPGGRPWSYPGPDGDARAADVYCDPATPAGARLVLVHGLVEAGKDDTRLQRLGEAFARHRFLVVVPDFPGMRALKIARQDVDEVRRAITAAVRLEGCPGAETNEGGAAIPGSARRVLATGVVGFSYSAGPALLALGGPDPAPADFAVLFGGYYDLADVLLFLTTGSHRDRGAEESGETIPEGRWVLLSANAAALASEADAEALRGIGALRRRDPRASIEAAAAGLGDGGRSVLDLVTNTDAARFPALLDRLDPTVRSLMDDLSPARTLHGPIGADLILIHGRGDAVIPYTQSLKLQRHVVAPGGPPRLVLLGGFRHARPQDDGGAWWHAALQHPADSLGLIDVLATILARRAPGNLTGPAYQP